MLNKEREKKKRKKDRRSRSPSNFELIFSQFEIRFNQVDVGEQIVQTKFIELNFVNEYCKISPYINFTIIFLVKNRYFNTVQIYLYIECL